MNIKDDNKPTIRIKTRITPFDDGTCRTCYHNHRFIEVKLENGKYITTPPIHSKHSDKHRHRKHNSLADLFWPSEFADKEDN